MRAIAGVTLVWLAVSLTVSSAQPVASQTRSEQKALAEAVRSLPPREQDAIEDRLKDLRVDLDAVIDQRMLLSLGQDYGIQREVKDRLKPVPIANGKLQPVLVQPAFMLYRELTSQEALTLATRVNSIGRIETRSGAKVRLEGTGFVALGGVATNCHVLSAIADRTNAGWRLRRDTRIDFSDDEQHREGAEYRVTGVASHSSVRGLDVAVLTVEQTSLDGARQLPAPLPIATARYAQAADPSLVAVVGYPDLENATGPLFRQLRGRTSQSKVYSPGAVLSVETLGAVDVLMHVANTTGGSSGSPVLSRDDFQVVAVHNCCSVGAAPPPAPTGLPCADVLMNRPFRNGAISMWSVSGDPAMRTLFFLPGPGLH